MMTYAEFCRVFDTVFRLNDLEQFATDANKQTFFALTEHMLQVNQSMNLTAIKEESAIITRHYADSLTVAAFLPQNAKIADIGCGAGFPSLPLAICRPDLTVTAIDSTEKRVRYVNDTAKLLGLQNLTALAMRAEDGGKGALRERFDVCTARAVADLPVLTELCLPFVRVGGRFIAMKAKRGEEELKNAAHAIVTLGGRLSEVKTVTLLEKAAEGSEESAGDTRVLISVDKITPTPAAYPRPYAKILKRPL